MRLPAHLASALDAGRSILVPDTARAAAVRHAWAGVCLERGHTSWLTPDVLTPAAWLQRAAQAERRTLLGSAFEWQALRRLAQGDSDPELANARADAWQRSLALIRDEGIDWNRVLAFRTPEADALLRARQALQDLERPERGMTAPSQYLPAPQVVDQATVAFGFDRIPAAWRHRLVAAPASSVAACQALLRHQAGSTSEEVRQAVGWALAKLAQPTARVLLVIPPGADYDAALQRELVRAVRLDGVRRRSIQLDRQQRLADTPVVRGLIFWLRLIAQPLAPAELCEGLLRHGAMLHAALPAAQLANRIRGQLTHDADARQLLRLASGHIELQATCEPLLAALRAAAAVLAAGGRRHDWPERIGDAMRSWHVDWALGADDDGQALQQAWQDLLHEVALLTEGEGGVTLESCCALLAARAARTRWAEPAEDSRLHIVRSGADPIVSYDGIWVCGLSASQWPVPPAPDAWVPKALQIDAGLNAADSVGRLREARAQLEAWRTATVELHLSHATLLDDFQASASPLLPATEIAPPLISLAPRADAAALETVANESFATEWRDAAAQGAYRINLFNDCPFRGSAELRLGVGEVRVKVPGLDAQESGTLTHAALRLIWSDLGGSVGLARLAADDEERFIRERLRRVLEAGPADSAVRDLARTVELERQIPRLRLLLQAERRRGAFEVDALEEKHRLTIEGVTIDLRIDRIDRVAHRDEDQATERLVIDYKTGPTGRPNWSTTSLHELQLLLYREALLAQGRPVRGLVAWEIGDEKLRSSGAVAQDMDLPRELRPRYVPADWDAAGASWTAWVRAAARGLWRGDARPRPARKTCQFCSLTSLCRRHELGAEVAVNGDDDSDEEGEA